MYNAFKQLHVINDKGYDVTRLLELSTAKALKHL